MAQSPGPPKKLQVRFFGPGSEMLIHTIGYVHLSMKRQPCVSVPVIPPDCVCPQGQVYPSGLSRHQRAFDLPATDALMEVPEAS